MPAEALQIWESNPGLRHGGELGGVLVLREGHAPRRLARLYAGRAVRARAGEDHADGPAAALLRQRSQEPVDGHVRSLVLRARGQPQHTLRDGEVAIG